jgi:hypothetical protein
MLLLLLLRLFSLLQAQLAGEDSVDFLAATPQTTSLSIARALATGSPRHPAASSSFSNAQLQEQQQQKLLAGQQQQQQDSSDGQQQQQQQQAQFFSAYGLAPFRTAQEQFLQMLQQDLAKVSKRV